MKKLFFVFSILFGMIVTKVSAYDIAVENSDGVMIYYSYTNANRNELSVEKNYSYYYKGNVVIPEEVTYNKKTLKVVGIASTAFSSCSELISVTIPASVTSIGYNAFGGCTGLTSITIPASVTSIGEGAFYDCI